DRNSENLSNYLPDCVWKAGQRTKNGSMNLPPHVPDAFA
ncbi:MAG: hypothetical protein ACI93T_002976, partial [Porticoccaceae bacterium]